MTRWGGVKRAINRPISPGQSIIGAAPLLREVGAGHDSTSVVIQSFSRQVAAIDLWNVRRDDALPGMLLCGLASSSETDVAVSINSNCVAVIPLAYRR